MAGNNILTDGIKSIICFCVADRAEYFHNLENDLGSLRNSKQELDRRKLLLRRVLDRRTGRNERLAYDAENWLEQVSRFEQDTEEMMEEAEEELRNKARFSLRRWISYSRVGSQVSSALKRAIQLMKEDYFLIGLANMPQKIVGFESIFEEIWRVIEDDSGGIIGLYGRRGAGKTTLLTMIYNSILSIYSVVAIWIEMPKEDPVKAIQQAICQKLEISGADKDAIWNSLKKKKFFLLLDDVEGQSVLSILEEAGVPLVDIGNGSKVIFTIRLDEVRDEMRADFIEVKPLSGAASLDLLEYNVGPGTLNAHPEIRKFAMDAIKFCEGLPLQLITFGRAMAGRTSFHEWNDAIQILKTDPARFENVETRIFSVFMLGYNTLRGDFLKKCFQYFSVLPEGKQIKIEQLVELWAAEGLLEEANDNIYDARERGAEVIERLKLAGLLVLKRDQSGDFVKMSDEILSMARWLACQQNRVLVQEKAFDFAKWANAEWISLFQVDMKISVDKMPPSCHHLSTLILKAVKLETIPYGFFKCMPRLKVLDLSDNTGLVHMPVDFGELGNLQFLNLSGTFIEEFPAGPQNWKKSLRIFVASAYLINARSIMISDLSSLQVFRIMLPHISISDEIGLLEELEKLSDINEIHLKLSSPASVKMLLDSPKLASCIKHLDVSSFSYLELSPSKMEHLEGLELSSPNLEKIEIDLTEEYYFLHLRFVSISNCPIKNVNWLVHAPELQTLSLSRCREMEAVVSNTSERILVFKSLIDLKLMDLPKLQYISIQDVKFSCLQTLMVSNCLKLERLTFGTIRADSIKEIVGGADWWSNLQLVNNEIKETLSSKFHPIEEKALDLEV